MSDTDRPARPQSVLNAIAFQKRSDDCYGAQRKREIEDLKCQVPDGLWPEEVKDARKGAVIGGVSIPARPMLSIPKLDQPVQIQMNQMRSAHLGVNIHPLSQKANKETAEIQQGLYRSIEVDSRADLARLWGADRALKCGMGWYRVNVVYDDTTDDPFDLTIRLERILRQGSVYPDPFAQQPDFSDGKELLYVSFMSKPTFDATYPKATVTSYDADELALAMDDAPFWFSGDKTSPAICVAEYFYTEYRDREWVILDDGSFAFADELPEGRRIQGEKRRKVKEPIVKWCKLNGAEELESGTWNGKFIPFIPCVGRELQTFDAERRWFGIYSTNKDSAHLFNVAVSNAVEKAALETKSQWVGAVGQFKTNNKQWQLSNVRNIPYLEYDPVTVNGNLAPPPSKPDQGGAALATSIALIQIADDNLQAGTATYDPSLGKNDHQDSGRKVLALQDQGLASNSHWLANLADISMTYESKVVLDLLPKIYDRAGRSVYVTGEDGEQTEVLINHPFTTDPQTGRPVMVPDWAEGDPIPKGATYYDLTEGKYGCVVSIGKRFETRAQQGADAFSQLLMAQPELIKFVGDIWMGFQDFPGHELAAKRLKAAMPPEIANADKEESDQPDPAMLQQQLKMAEQGAQMMKQVIEEQGKAIETEQIKHQADLQRAEMEITGKVQIEQVKSQLAITLQQMKDAQALALERMKQLHADEDREDTQKHDAAMAGADAAEASAAAERAEAHAAQMAEQGHEQSIESGAIAHEQGLEAQATAAQGDGASA